MQKQYVISFKLPPKFLILAALNGLLEQYIKRKLKLFFRIKIYTANMQSTNPKKPFIIGVTGGTASGKTTVCEIIMKRIGVKQCTLVGIDAFYKDLTYFFIIIARLIIARKKVKM